MDVRPEVLVVVAVDADFAWSSTAGAGSAR
jgi:hypothetical protein